MPSTAALSAATATPDAATSEVLPARWQRLDIWITLALMAVTVIVSLVTIVRAPEYSRYDEFTHADYAYQLWNGELPAPGDTLNTDLLNDWACRGDSKREPPVCGSLGAVDSARYIYNAYNYNFFHPPVYYGAVGVFAGVANDVTGVSFVTMARVASGLLVALGIGAIYLAIRSWRVRPVLAATGAAALLVTPMVGHSAAIVNPDAMAMLVGAGAIWITSRIVIDKRVPILSASLIMLLAAGSKVILAMPLVAVGLFFGIDGIRRWIRGDRKFGGQLIALAGIAALVLVIVYIGWGRVQAGRGDPLYLNPMTGLSTQEFQGSVLGTWLGSSLFGMFGIGGDYWMHPQINGWGTQLAGSFFALAAAVVPVLALVHIPRGAPARAALYITLVGFVLVPLVVQVQAYLDQGRYFPNMTTRYGLALLPLCALLGALLLERHPTWRRWIVGAVGVSAAAYLASVAGIL